MPVWAGQRRFRCGRSVADEKGDLAAGAVDALDEDALDVGGLRRAGDPDDVRVGGERGDSGGKIGEDLLAAERGDMHPRRERSEAARGDAVGEDQRAGLGDGAGG